MMDKNAKCEQLHLWFNSLKKHTYYANFVNNIPENGIYIQFEIGETGHSGDRIVRIGTHRGQNNLSKRLEEHYENNGRSIFRRKVGSAIIKKSLLEGAGVWIEKDLKDWNYGDYFEREQNFIEKGRGNQYKEIQNQVSAYIRTNIYFVCFEVYDEKVRKDFEARLISTVSNCTQCQQSEKWLGKYSDKPKVVKSGLWQEQHLWEDDISDDEMNMLEKIIKKK
jgi:hypothetical protein